MVIRVIPLFRSKEQKTGCVRGEILPRWGKHPKNDGILLHVESTATLHDVAHLLLSQLEFECGDGSLLNRGCSDWIDCMQYCVSNEDERLLLSITSAEALKAVGPIAMKINERFVHLSEHREEALCMDANLVLYIRWVGWSCSDQLNLDMQHYIRDKDSLVVFN
jgi:hypothetical protein